MNVFDALVFGMGSARSPRLRLDRAASWPTWGVVTVAAVVWVFVALPLTWIVLIGPGPMRLVLLAALGPSIFGYTAALAVAISVATKTVERESGHRLAGILLNTSLALTGIGLTALVLIGAWTFMHVMFNSG